MITLLVVLVALVPYFLVGVHAARRNLPASWERARREWFTTGYQRSDVRAGYLTMVLFWPIRLPARAIREVADREIKAGDPKAIQERMQQQERDLANRDRRIAELERELGIGQS